MSGQKTARIFYPNTPLEHGFHQIAQAAENRDDECQYHPVDKPEVARHGTEAPSHDEGGNDSPYRAFPCLFGRNTWEQRGLSKSRAGQISPRVIHPCEEQQSKNDHGAEVPIFECNKIEQGKGRPDIYHAEYDEAHVLKWFFRMDKEFVQKGQKDEWKE